MPPCKETNKSYEGVIIPLFSDENVDTIRVMTVIH